MSATRTLRNLALFTLLSGAVGCRDGDGLVVAALTITGNQAFTQAALKAQLATRSTGFLAGLMPWVAREPFDKNLFEADLRRLESFYADRGYPDARVTRGDVAVSPNGASVRLTIHVEEGQPVRLDRIEIHGLDGLPAPLATAARQVPLAPGDLYDKARVLDARDRVAGTLRDRGYPAARVTSHVEEGSAPRRLVLTLDVTPGEPGDFGEVSVVGLNKVKESLVRRTLTFRPGQPYREGQLLESERRLSGLGLFSFAHVASNPDANPTEGSRPVTVTVKEGKPTNMRAGVGYGTEDGPRGSFEWRHLNLFGRAQQFTTIAKYSSRLSGGEVNLVQPYIAHGQSLGTSATAWWRDETIFTSREIGGEARLAFQLGADRGPGRSPLVRHAVLTYSAEELAYTIAPEALSDPSTIFVLIAFGIDPTTGTASGRLTEVSFTYDQAVFDQAVDPHRGYGFSLRGGHAAPWLGGTYRFDAVDLHGSAHVPLGRIVWASQARFGAMVANSPADVPFSSRYFLGGATSLRGWGRFEVSPLSPDGIPIGGLAMLELSSELRVPVRGNIGAVGFIDAGNAWLRPADFRLNNLRSDVGVGLRYVASFGVVRVDLGWQLTPIPTLMINGEPQAHRWRIHFSLGHAF